MDFLTRILLALLVTGSVACGAQLDTTSEDSLSDDIDLRKLDRGQACPRVPLETREERCKPGLVCAVWNLCEPLRTKGTIGQACRAAGAAKCDAGLVCTGGTCLGAVGARYCSDPRGGFDAWCLPGLFCANDACSTTPPPPPPPPAVPYPCSDVDACMYAGGEIQADEVACKCGRLFFNPYFSRCADLQSGTVEFAPPPAGKTRCNE